MDYEQKYKSLITEIKERMTLISAEKEKASSQVDKLSLGGRVAILQELLAFTHELKESEDERIRKGLIKGLSTMRDIYKRTTFSDDAINIDDAIAWLEKQGEKVIDCTQNHQDVNHPNGGIVLEDFNGGEGFYKLNLDYLNKNQVEEIEELVRTWNTESNSSNNENIRACIEMCLTDADEQRFKDYNTNLKECITWLDKQYETENENDTDFTIYYPLRNGNGKYECIPYSFYGSLTSFSKDEDLIDFLRNCFYTKKECEEWIEKQGEQKPTPKFKIGDTIHKIGENTVFPRTIEKIEDGDYVCNNSHSFVNIKFQDDYELVEQKPSWSEEDEKMLDSIIDCIDGLCFIDSDQLNWLKSLKPNHWKPSTEQLNALKQCIGGYYSEEADKKLESLYDDLKKLES